MPTALVSSKCDNPPTSWDVDPCKIEGACSNIEGVESFQTSATAPETHKRCVSVILRNIAAGRDGKPLLRSTSLGSLVLVILTVLSHYIVIQDVNHSQT